MFSQNRIDEGPSGDYRALDIDGVAERESLRGLLARPFYWLGLVAVAVLLIVLWSAEHIEGVRATDLE